MAWQRTLREMSNFVPPESFKVLDGQLRPKPLYRTRFGHGRLATRAMTTSSSVLASVLEDKQSTPGGKGDGHGYRQGIVLRRYQFNTPPYKGADCPATDNFDLELAPRDNYQTEAAFSTMFIAGHTIPTGSALAAEFSGVGSWGRSPLSQQRHGCLSRHLRRRQVFRRYGEQLQLMARA